MHMFPGPFRHLASDLLNDLVTAVLVALAAVIASGLLDRIWEAPNRYRPRVQGHSPPVGR
jgi:hypothetical protein